MVLKSSGITKEETRQNPETVLKVLQFHDLMQKGEQSNNFAALEKKDSLSKLSSAASPPSTPRGEEDDTDIVTKTKSNTFSKPSGIKNSISKFSPQNKPPPPSIPESDNASKSSPRPVTSPAHNWTHVGLSSSQGLSKVTAVAKTQATPQVFTPAKPSMKTSAQPTQSTQPTQPTQQTQPTQPTQPPQTTQPIKEEGITSTVTVRQQAPKPATTKRILFLLKIQTFSSMISVLLDRALQELYMSQPKSNLRNKLQLKR
eukprot:TRINITY_DN1272_c1_g1_i1.p1 TRINITY_DN1272_c1_g1~~TRINITY_DN1272_c1_g1_i1.p1  ORF type:complete len:258 (-),score=68.49 TRINITY_DN1272_c1_g1_i1:802-1575(-)